MVYISMGIVYTSRVVDSRTTFWPSLETCLISLRVSAVAVKPRDALRYVRSAVNKDGRSAW